MVEIKEPALLVPLSTFNALCLDKSNISYENWWKNLKIEFLEKVSDTDFSNGAIQLTINETYAQCLKGSNILERIQQAQERLKGLYPFLGTFSNESNPLIFWKQFNSLSSKQSQKLNSILEDGDGMKILKNAIAEDVICDALRFELASIAPVEKKKNTLINTVFVFESGFDFNMVSAVPIPIALFDLKDFTDDFRSCFTRDPIIRFNGEALVIPSFKDQELSNEDYVDHFIEWLLCEIQTKIDASKKWDGQILRKAFALGPRMEEATATKLQKLITKALQKDVKSQKTLAQKLTSCFQALQNEKDTFIHDFSGQMLPWIPYLVDYLPTQDGYNSQNWQQVSKNIIGIYRRIYRLKEKHLMIPSLALFQAMSFCGFTTCIRLFQDGLCPAYFKSQDRRSYEFNRDFTPEYDIYFDPNTSCFQVKHIKSFNLFERPQTVTNGSSNKTIDTVFTTNWTISGQLGVDCKYGAELNLPKMKFLCPYEQREMIIDQFSYDFKDTIWAKCVKLKKIGL